jgi:hypothetical protein
MTAAQEGQVIPFASAVTLLTCATTGSAINIVNNASRQIPIRRFILKSFFQFNFNLKKENISGSETIV